MTTTPSATIPRPARVLVTGATGKTGRRVAGALREQGIAVRADSRSSVVAAERFDGDDHRTWDASLDGVDAVYLTYHPDLAAPGAPQGALRDAVRAGVGVIRLLGRPGRSFADFARDTARAESCGSTAEASA